MKLQIIGSSPAWPNPGGAHAGLLVSGAGSLLLDCGPGVLARLREGYSENGWPRVDAIAITHFHLDHWGDLVPWVWGNSFGLGHGMPQPVLRVPPGGRERLRSFGTDLGRAEMFESAFRVSEYEERTTFEAAGFRVTPLRVPHYRLDYSHPTLVGWKVSVYPPKGSTQQAMTFYMDVTLSGSGGERRWRVSNWSPASMLSAASGGPAGAEGSGQFAIDRPVGDDLESRVNPAWLLLAFVPLAFVVLVVGAKGVRDWRRTAAVERDYRSTSNPS